MIILLLFLGSVGAELFTEGPWIVEGTKRVRLRCVNWYGIHQELSVAGGLETTSITNITRQIVKMNANCVRLPFSMDAVQLNPTLREPQAVGWWIHDECGANLTAMSVMDCQIRILTQNGLMVILNNHNSWSGWVGDKSGVLQGLWAMPNSARYGFSEWIDCVEAVAARYRHNELVVGFDLRNEVHDCYGVKVTWGESTDPTTDWKAAASAANYVLEMVNPRLLVIVGGMCMGYDITPLLANPGPIGALERRKLVYTTHVYTFSFWWEHAGDKVNLVILSFTLFVLSVLSMGVFANGVYFGDNSHFQTLIYTATGLCPFIVPLVTVGMVWGNIFMSIGCSTTAFADVYTAFTMAGVILGVTLPAVIHSWMSTRRGKLRKILSMTSFWGVFFSMVLFYESLTLHTYAMVEWELGNRWGAERNIPLWVGEFGAGWDTTNPEWMSILRYIRENDLDFAYWSLNGNKFRNNTYEDESFGLLDMTYSRVRNKDLVAYLFS